MTSQASERKIAEAVVDAFDDDSEAYRWAYAQLERIHAILTEEESLDTDTQA